MKKLPPFKILIANLRMQISLAASAAGALKRDNNFSDFEFTQNLESEFIQT